MKKHLLAIVALVTSTLSYAQCAETPKEKILLVGDSWAFFMNFDGTINSVANNWGHSNVKYYTNLTLSENGAETDDFLLPSKITELTNKLTTMPDLEVVHLSIGGNDFLGNWNIAFSESQTEELADAVIGRLDSIVAIIHSTRPDVHIFWSGYVYTNFGEVLGSLPGFMQSTHPFHGTWSNMGFPTFPQLNTIQNWFQQRIITHYAADPKFSYVHATGLMQYIFGQTSNLQVSPGDTYPPLTVPMPEGNPNYPSPRTTMRNYGVFTDCFHLSQDGYNAFISHHFQKFYHKFLMSDAYTLANYIKSGHVSNAGPSATNIVVGKQGSEQYTAIFELDNTHIDYYAPDRLSLFFQIEEINGVNLLQEGAFEISIKHGHFGNSSILEEVDYSASADASSTSACVYGTIEAGKWVRIELPATFNDYVRKSKSQIRITYTGAADAVLRIKNSTDLEFQPTLDITYGASTLGIVSTSAHEKIEVYPNPAKNQLYINTAKTIEGVWLYSTTGQLISSQQTSSKMLDISTLTPGVYLLQVKSETGIETIRILKD